MRMAVDKATIGATLEVLQTQFFQFRLQILPGLELDNRPRGNNDILIRLVRVSPDAGLSLLHFEDPKIAQFHVAAFFESTGDHIKGLLDDIPDMLLRVTGGFVNRKNDISLG